MKENTIALNSYGNYSKAILAFKVIGKKEYHG
jgi:hypothetical protein